MAVVEGGSLLEILQRVFIRLLAAVQADEQLRAAMEIALFKTEQSVELLAGREEQAKASADLLAWITEVMRRGISGGELRSDLAPEDMARAFMSLQNGAVYLWLSDPQAFSLDKSAEALAEIFLAGITPR